MLTLDGRIFWKRRSLHKRRLSNPPRRLIGCKRRRLRSYIQEWRLKDIEPSMWVFAYITYPCSVSLIELQLKNAYKDSQQEQEGKRAELRQLEDELIRSKRDLERHTTRLKETGTTAESSEAENLKVCVIHRLHVIVMLKGHASQS